MSPSPDSVAQPTPGSKELQPLPPGLIARQPWLAFLLPFVVYSLLNALEPKPPIETQSTGGWFTFKYQYYPLIYTVKIVLTLLTMALVWPGYRAFRFRVRPLAVVAGIVGAVVWIVLAKLQLEARLLAPLGLDGLLALGERSAFNPLEQLEQPALAYGFLAVRFVGLVVVISIIEEFFLRGFLMRLLTNDRWWELPLDQVNRLALVAGTVVPMLTHPGELLAAAVWFTAVTWLMLRTGNLWDCITAHAVTNLLLGLYVVASGDWWLW